VRDARRTCATSTPAARSADTFTVGGIVEELDLESICGVVHGGGRIEEPLDDVSLVVDGQLDRDARPLDRRLGRRRILIGSAVTTPEESEQMQPMEPVEREHGPDEKVRGQECVGHGRRDRIEGRLHAAHDATSHGERVNL
jgi:hypothetical protein